MDPGPLSRRRPSSRRRISEICYFRIFGLFRGSRKIQHRSALPDPKLIIPPGKEELTLKKLIYSPITHVSVPLLILRLYTDLDHTRSDTFYSVGHPRSLMINLEDLLIPLIVCPPLTFRCMLTGSIHTHSSEISGLRPELKTRRFREFFSLQKVWLY